jgi:hypothetical protein
MFPIAMSGSKVTPSKTFQEITCFYPYLGKKTGKRAVALLIVGDFITMEIVSVLMSNKRA